MHSRVAIFSMVGVAVTAAIGCAQDTGLATPPQAVTGGTQSLGGNSSNGGAVIGGTSNSTGTSPTNVGGANNSSSGGTSNSATGGTSNNSSSDSGSQTGGANSDTNGGTSGEVGGSSSEEGGATSTGGTSSEGGTSSSSSTANGGNAGIACEHLPLPNGKAEFLNFSVFGSDGTWGSSTGDNAGLTGGTSKYTGTDCTITHDASAGNLHITSSLVASGYSGLTFWFGPCLDVQSYTGIQFTMGGTLPTTATVKFMVQTNADYPIDAKNTKGACSFTDENTKWSTCVSPTATISVSSSPALIKVPFSSLSGGKPTPTVDANELLGLQLQFECSSTGTCSIDVTMDDVAFYK